jgi:hypothetical protein
LLTILPYASAGTILTEKGLLLFSANSYFSTEKYVSRPCLVSVQYLTSERSEILAEFEGNSSILFQTANSRFFIGLDNKLFVSESLKSWSSTLTTEYKENTFWHLISASEDTLFVQEYGPRPSSIYRSTDNGETWKRIVTCKEIDNKARHFHSVSYDNYRNILIATLGDGNLVKIVVSKDLGATWKPVYRSAFQCLPIVISEEFNVFGMDSSITNGLLLWYPKINKWRSIHLKFVGQKIDVKNLQCSDLKRTSKGVWVMSTGGGSIFTSKDLLNWSSAILGTNSFFSAHNISNEFQGQLAISMGKETALLDSNPTYSNDTIDFLDYKASIAKLKGLIYVLKRLPDRIA